MSLSRVKVEVCRLARCNEPRSGRVPPSPRRRKIAFAVLAIAALISWHGTGTAQPFPNRPVRIVVPQSPGTPADNIARTLAEQLGEFWNQTVVIESKPGAGGTIAADLVAKSPADGYTLMLANSSNMAIAPAVDPGLRYDAVADFTPIGRLIHVPFLVVANAAVPARSMPELVDYARAHPGRLTYVSFGEATVTHMAFESLKATAGIDVVEVGYRTFGQALPDIVAGRVDLCLCDYAAVRQYVDAGQLRLLGATGARRAAGVPHVPTVEEQGVPGFALGMWYGVVAPAGLPSAVRANIVAALGNVRRTPAMKQRIEFLDYLPIYDDPGQFATTIRSEIDEYSRIVKRTRVAADPKPPEATR